MACGCEEGIGRVLLRDAHRAVGTEGYAMRVPGAVVEGTWMLPVYKTSLCSALLGSLWYSSYMPRNPEPVVLPRRVGMVDSESGWSRIPWSDCC